MVLESFADSLVLGGAVLLPLRATCSCSPMDFSASLKCDLTYYAVFKIANLFPPVIIKYVI